MAAYINEQLKDMTRCCICTEVYSDPRMLSCIHTFCLRCLEQIGMLSNKKPKDKLPCPVCRKEFIIPDEGMNGVQKNFFMDNIIEMTKISNPPEKTSCTFCLEAIEHLDDSVEDLPVATVCCIDCHENLCDDCSMHHKKQKPTRNHQIVPLGSEVVPRQVAPLKSCNQHSNEHLKIYCFHCKTVVCVICFVESHKSHECTDINKVADDFRQKIGQDAQKMTQLLSEGTTRLTRLEEVRTDVNRKVDFMEKEIRVRVDDLKMLIDKHLQSQLENLWKRKVSMLKKLEVDQNETKQHLTIVESFQSYCSEVRSKGSPGDVCASANDLHTRSNELQQLHQSCIRVPVATFNCSFCKMELEEILELRDNNILGCMKGKRS